MLWVLLALHDEKVSTSDIHISERELTWAVDAGLDGLRKAIRLPDDLGELELTAAKPAIVQFLLKGMSLEINGREAKLEPGAVEPIYEPYLGIGERRISRVLTRFRFGGEGIDTVRLGIKFFSDLTKEHRALVNVRWGDLKRPFSLMGPRELELTYRSLDPSFASTVGQFLLWGMHHIFIGYDHIAFLLALLLAASRLVDIVKIVSSFTLAHSITLLLAASEVVRVRQDVTEALIAASIVYVAVENFFIKEARHRWALAFVFGLVHGLGFAGTLRDRLTDDVLVPVVSFNVGVELGQLAILSVLYPALIWLRGASEEKRRRLVLAGSMPLMLLGSCWLVDRVFKLDFMPF